MEEQRGDTDHQARSGGDQRLGDASCEKRCVGHARAHEGAEDLDHAQHGPQQTEQGCNAGDGAQGVEIALQVVNDAGGGLLDALLHDLATTLGIAQAGGEDLTQRGVGAQLLEFLVAELLVLDPLPDLA